MKRLISLLIVAVFSISVLTGCSTKRGTYASIGSVLGGLAGAVVCDSKNREGCIAAGAAAGAAAGYGLGHSADVNDAEKDQLYQNQQDMANRMNADRQAHQQALTRQQQEMYAQQQYQDQQRFAKFKAGYRQVIPFTKGSAVLSTFASNQLDNIAREIKQYPQMIIIVTGYADGRGASNESLAMRRAFSVKSYLSMRGLNNVDVNYATVPNGDARARAAVITLR